MDYVQKSSNRAMLIAEIIGAFFVAGGAFLFHFLYEWSGYNFFVGIFAATNESIFEHTKILFYPFIIFSIIEYFFLKIDIKRYIAAKAISAIILIILTISVFYTYTGIIGHNIGIVDMISAIAYAFIASWLSYVLLRREKTIRWFIPATIAFIIVLVFMIIFTINPPHIPLFYDTMNEVYGAVKK